MDLFAWILPALFDMDNDVTLWMVYLTCALGVYAVIRVIGKFVQKVINTID